MDLIAVLVCHNCSLCCPSISPQYHSILIGLHMNFCSIKTVVNNTLYTKPAIVVPVFTGVGNFKPPLTKASFLEEKTNANLTQRPG